MKAIEILSPGGAEQLVFAERPMPRPVAGQVLIRVHAIGVNRADCLQRRGLYPAPKGESDIPGLEVAGVVESIGPDVASFGEGDRVFAILGGGGYAEYVAVDQRCVLPMPESLTPVAAAGIAEVFATAWHALHVLAKMQSGETVLVHAGASGVGTAAIQIARLYHANVLVTAGSAEKCTKCVALGASAGCNYREEDFSDFVREQTSGRGVDVILDMVGADYFNRNIDCLAADGRLVILALQSGHTVSRVPLSSLLLKRLSLFGHALRNQPETKAAVMQLLRQHALDAFADGRLRPVIDRVFAWQEASAAHVYMESNQNVGKIILEMTD